jgi:hypothetical protein
MARVTDNIRGVWIDTGVRWQSVTGEANLIDFGGDPTGGTDSSGPLSDSLTAAISAQAPLRIPTGHFKINASVTKTLAAGVPLTIRGDGAGSILDGTGMTYTSGYGQPVVPMISITGTVSGSDPENVVRISNITLYGGATTVGGQSGLELHSVGQTILEGVVATKFAFYAVLLDSIRFASVIESFISSKYYANLFATGVSLKVFGGEYDSAGNGLGPNYLGDPAKALGYGIVADAQQVYIAGVRAYSNDRYAIDFRAGSDVVIDGNYIYNTGLYAIYGQNYEINTNGGLNIKITNNTIDNADRAGSGYGIVVGPWAQGTNWGLVNEILISGNTIKRTTRAIKVDTHKLTTGSAAVRKLLITQNQIEHTSATNAGALGQIYVGTDSPDSTNDRVESSIITDNILWNGGIVHTYGENAEISRNKITFDSSPLDHEQVILCYANQCIENSNTVSYPGTFTRNPFFNYNSGAPSQPMGLSNIKEMRGNLINGTAPLHITDYSFTDQRIVFKYKGPFPALAQRDLIHLVTLASTDSSYTIHVRYAGVEGTGAGLTSGSGALVVSFSVNSAGTVTLPGASPYTITPYATSSVGSITFTWVLTAVTNGAQLALRTNGDSVVTADIEIHRSGTLAASPNGIQILNVLDGITYTN